MSIFLCQITLLRLRIRIVGASAEDRGSRSRMRLGQDRRQVRRGCQCGLDWIGNRRRRGLMRLFPLLLLAPPQGKRNERPPLPPPRAVSSIDRSSEARWDPHFLCLSNFFARSIAIYAGRCFNCKGGHQRDQLIQPPHFFLHSFQRITWSH